MRSVLNRNYQILTAVFFAFAALAPVAPSLARDDGDDHHRDGKTDVTTYHYDSMRTGWNRTESTLTPHALRSGRFGLLKVVRLDEQVDAQPLLVRDVRIEGRHHNVVYVVTENNSVYAIDAQSGQHLKKVNLGTAVPRPLSCENGGATVGIDGTPTIDLHERTLYVVAYVLEGSTPIHQLHALDLETLNDRPGSPVTVAASGVLQDGTSYSFDSSVQRQRAALLQANGNIYVGFGSYCDFKASQSRGWVLGWKKTTLAPLAHAELLDKATTASATFDCYHHAPWTSNHPCFLSSVWMSGYGLASDKRGHLFFTTGNTALGIYDSTQNLAESVVKLSPDLSKVLDFFTPADENSLDAGDTDFGSGGTLVLPDQPGPVPHLAVAAGKEGNLFIVDRDTGHMGGFSAVNVPKAVSIGGCWCGPSYFKGSDHVGRVVSSGGLQVEQWTVNTSQSPALSLEASAPAMDASGQDPGFFTAVSSDGERKNTAVIWSVDRPVGAHHQVRLYAYDATPAGPSLPQLWSGEAGTWPNTNGNANIVPVVANGRVYVASYKRLRIFGLREKHEPELQFAGEELEPASERAQFTPPTGPLYWGTIRAVDGSRITLELRTGRMLAVNVAKVVPQATSDFGAIGRALAVSGSLDSDGMLVASGIWRAKGASLWGEDREQ